jgi:hypothetical protein
MSLTIPTDSIAALLAFRHRHPHISQLNDHQAFWESLSCEEQDRWRKVAGLAKFACGPSDQDVARICHEANAGYCRALGDNSQPSWQDAPEWQRSSAINGVNAHLAKEMTPEQSHQGWLDQKIQEGWIWGPVKDPVKKEHPCMCPYNELPVEQRAKDHIFSAIVGTFRNK